MAASVPLSPPASPALSRPAAGAAWVDVPGVWRGDSLRPVDEAPGGRAQPSGHPALDAQLPGGGWPRGAMSEVLLAGQGRPEWPLLLPALAGAVARPGQVVLVAPPFEPFVPVLHAAGLPAGRLCWVAPPADGRDAAAAWACEQALRCRDVLAVLAWLPAAHPDMLRRLQLAAAQRGPLLWVFRPEFRRLQASPAPLRLWVRPGEGDGALQVHVLKRRGAPLLSPVAVPAHGAALATALTATSGAKQRHLAAWREGMAARTAPSRLRARGERPEAGHELDRTAVPAG